MSFKFKVATRGASPKRSMEMVNRDDEFRKTMGCHPIGLLLIYKFKKKIKNGWSSSWRQSPPKLFCHSWCLWFSQFMDLQVSDWRIDLIHITKDPAKDYGTSHYVMAIYLINHICLNQNIWTFWELLEKRIELILMCRDLKYHHGLPHNGVGKYVILRLRGNWSLASFIDLQSGHFLVLKL